MALHHWPGGRQYQVVVICRWNSDWGWGIGPCRRSSAVECQWYCQCRQGLTVSMWSASADQPPLAAPTTDTAAPNHSISNSS